MAEVHPAREQLLAYHRGELGDAASEDIELHLCDCDACAEISSRCFAIVQATEYWTAASHAGVEQRLLIDHAIRTAGDQIADPALRERLERWRNAWTGLAEAALRTVLHTGERARRASAENMESLLRPGSAWSFTPAPSFGGTWGSDEEAGDETVLSTASVSPGMPRAVVQLSGGERGEIVVRIEQLPTYSDPPLIMLVAIEATNRIGVQVAVPEPRPGTGVLIARFAKLAPGEYVVAMEPLD